MLRTKKEIDYKSAPYGRIATIPMGTPVVRATNLPEKDKYWCEAWSEEMNEQEDGWLRNYGFLLSEDEVEDCEDGELVVVDGKDLRVMNLSDIESAVFGGEAATISIHGTDTTYRKYSVPCSWQMYGHAEVVATDWNDAVSTTEGDTCNLPEGSYVDGSFEVDYALIDEKLEEDEYEES